MVPGTSPDVRGQGDRDVLISRPADRTAAAPGRTAALVTDDGLLHFLRARTTRPGAQDDAAGADDDLVDAELMTRLQGVYAEALPSRLSAIDRHTRAGDAAAVASAAHALAGTSGQLGHPEVAAICQEIAADARRGVLAHSRVARLHELAGRC